MEQSSENTSVHANIWQTAPCARYAGTMKISRDFSPLKRLQRLGSTCPDEGMGRTQTFHRPNQGDKMRELKSRKQGIETSQHWHIQPETHSHEPRDSIA